MPLIFPENRTEYLGEIHFSSLEDSITNGQDVASVSQNAQKNADELGASVNDVVSFFGGDDSLLPKSAFGASIPNEKCILFLPQSLSFSDKANYGSTDLGIIGGAIEAGILGAKAGGDKGSINSFIDGLKGPNGKAIGQLAVQNVVGAFGGDQISGALKSANKITTNPNTRALFESVPLRAFSFTFKMIPHSRQEARNIKEIIAFFRKELYPEEIPFDETNPNIKLSVGYKFPNKFQIQMYYGKGNQKKEVGIKIKPCYLTDITTVFNSSSMGMHYDGEFTEVDLTLSFLEARALSRKDIIDEGFEDGVLGELGESLGL